MARSKHPKKEIESALNYAESQGWRIEKSSGQAHCWGTIYCTLEQREGCKMSVASTPRSPQNHGKQIIKKIDNCPHA